MHSAIFLAALATLCFTACRITGDASNTQPVTPTNVAATRENATPAVEAIAASEASAQGDAEPSLVSLSAGAIIVKKPQEYSTYWSAVWILDERSKSGWATPKNVTSPQVIVIALPEQTLLNKLVFDIAGVDGAVGGARKTSSLKCRTRTQTKDFGRSPKLSLRDKADNQQFPVSAPAPGRWLRLTVKNNHGSTEYTELMDFRASGKQLTKTPLPRCQRDLRFELRQVSHPPAGHVSHRLLRDRLRPHRWRRRRPRANLHLARSRATDMARRSWSSRLTANR